MTTPALTFTATLEIVPGCAECSANALRLTAQAIEQRGMQSITLRSSKRHNHRIEALPEARQPEPDIDGSLFTMPTSDTNGFDPEGRP